MSVRSEKLQKCLSLISVHSFSGMKFETDRTHGDMEGSHPLNQYMVTQQSDFSCTFRLVVQGLVTVHIQAFI